MDHDHKADRAARRSKGLRNTEFRKRYRRPSQDACPNNSLQGQLLVRAIAVAERKKLNFFGDVAAYLREIVEGTAARALGESGQEPVAFDERVVSKIDKAFAVITLVVETTSNYVKDGATLTVDLLRRIMEIICPLPPLCQ